LKRQSNQKETDKGPIAGKWCRYEPGTQTKCRVITMRTRGRDQRARGLSFSMPQRNKPPMIIGDSIGSLGSLSGPVICGSWLSRVSSVPFWFGYLNAQAVSTSFFGSRFVETQMQSLRNQECRYRTLGFMRGMVPDTSSNSITTSSVATRS